MTATLHKILAGNSYLYYLRQVAAGDSTNLGSDALADYYSAHGEAPGRWHGTGLTALGLCAGDHVTEEQMKTLFGQGRHPDAIAIQNRVFDHEVARGATTKAARDTAEKATRLGNPYRVYDSENEYRERCGQAFRAHNISHGNDPAAAISNDARARIRTEVATAMFTGEFGRAPLDARELSSWVARASRPKGAAVAGFDITFSPVKSVSALWAIAPKATSERIAAAHEAAVDDAMGWLERHGIYTRMGRNGVRQVDVEGIVAARFTHRESRCGDPDLHTHLVIANRVRTLDGRWRTLDGAMIYRLVVTVSEIYNSRLEHHLTADLGIGFAERPGTDPGKRPIREIIGMPWLLIEHWSRRDAAITARLGELATAFQTRVGREPMPKEMYGLSQQATLETRPRKHALRSWAEQRADWRAQALGVLGGREAVANTLTAVFHQPVTSRRMLDAHAVARVSRDVVETVSAQRSTWQWHHIRAEAERCLRGLVDRDRWAETVEAVTAQALAPPQSIPRGDPDAAAEPVLGHVPDIFRRLSGASVYSTDASTPYTSARRLGVTEKLIDLSLQPGARTIPEPLITAAIDAYNRDPVHTERQLNAGQIAVVRAFGSSPWRIETTNAPAGAGKTTAMRVLVDAWHSSDGTVLGLAPTASAAAQLGASTGARAETVDRLLTIIDAHRPADARTGRYRDRFPAALPQWVLQIDRRTLVIVDEHIKLGDDKRLRLFEFLAARGATIRCVGDDRQLPAIEAAGSAADTADAARASTLSHVVRFTDTTEATASLLLRDGDPTGLAFHLDHQRIHSGAPGTVHDHAYIGWIKDHLSGRDTVMLAPTHTIVTELNERARADRLARSTTDTRLHALLSDELSASAGDIICTRRNDPKLRLGQHDWVRNGYRWIVTAVHPDGSITAAHLQPGRDAGHSTVLPANYVRAHVRLGYAITVDSAQGITVDTCHIVVTGAESRNQLYVALTRGAHANHLYIPTAIDGSEASFWTEPGLMPRTELDVLLRILASETTQISAHAQLRDALDPYRRIGHAVDIYLDAVGLAAEHALGADAVARLDDNVEHLRPGLTDAPAYPVLRQHLATIAISGRDPITALRNAIAARELDTADDPAAVLDWRLDPSGKHSAGTGPLPWIRGVPPELPDNAITEQLHARARIITDLARHIARDARDWNAANAPVWARPLLGNPRLITDLATWRAANHVPDTDLRPTGPARHPVLERDHQALLDARVTDIVGDLHTAVSTWSGLAKRVNTRIVADPWWPVLAERLDTAATAGLDIDALLTDAAAQRPLPDQMPAAALWLRLGLDPAALSTTAAAQHLRPEWTDHLHQLLGDDTADRVTADLAWPRLVAALDRATGTDWTPTDLLTTAYELLRAAQPDTTEPRPDRLTTALAWRIEALLRPETPTTPEPATQPATETAHDMDTHHSPSQTDPRPDSAARPPRTDPDASIPEQLHAVSQLFRSGRIDEATSRFGTMTRQLSLEERDILEKVANTLYANSFPVARARLRWAADQHPQHRDLIIACIPDTDPHIYNPDNGASHPTSAHTRAETAARNHREWTDHTRRTSRPPDTGQDFVEGYLNTRGTIDDDPNHLPLPHGINHHYQPDGRDTPRPDGYAALDYTRAAVPRTHGFGCLHCGIERAVHDTTPTRGRRGDDGLCGECRDGGHPGIPDHTAADHIPARCAHITATYPPDQAQAKLRRDWRDAPTRRDRHAIHTWVTQHPFPDTPHAATPTIDVSDPVQLLTDSELTANITHTEHRLTMPADENILFGPATPDDEEKQTEATVHVGWLHNELADLHAEQHRRTQLTPDLARAEHLLRQHHRPDLTTDPNHGTTPDGRDPSARHEDLGL
ncbi:MobF family relaxase [Nocardia vaccinii]|uniref:MobF family relaxase n=1 Tax=Nocardia vaccinii TaxID=1822 RepID=UPI001470ADB2|nr:MobF family relaxase [Nocardia vaccinii]